MAIDITEDWIRSLTGWKPFKEGKTMADNGLVTELKKSAAGDVLQANIREGRLNLRPTVKIAGPSDVRVQCGCPDFRATGGVCAHAVAVLLSSLKPAVTGAAAGRSPLAASPDPAAPPIAPQAWEIHLSPRLETEWPEGKLSLRFAATTGTPAPQDPVLSAWLAARKVPAGVKSHPMRLSGSDLAEFLDLAAGHPRIAIDSRKGSFRLEEDPGPPLRLADSRLEGDRLVLDLTSGQSAGKTLVLWGEGPALLSRDSAARLPAKSANPLWMRQLAELLDKGRIGLPVERFLEDYDAWMDLFEPPQPGWLGTLRLAGAQPEFWVELDGSLDAVEALLRVRYPGLPATPIPPVGDPISGLPRLAPDGHLQARNPTAEEQARRRLLALGFSAGANPARFQMRGREEVLGLIADGLPLLRGSWSVKLSERFGTAVGRVHVVSPEIREVADHGSSLVFELSFQTRGGKHIPSAEIRRILRGGKRSVKLSNGMDLVVRRNAEELVNPLIEELGIGRPDERFQLQGASALLFQNLREILSLSLKISDKHNIDNHRFTKISNDGLNASLRPYQEEGASWLNDRLQRLGGALLADEMGLGKTLQTIASINHFKQSEPEVPAAAMVVAPTSLLGNWIAEIKRFAPSLRVLLFHGQSRDKLRQQAEESDVIVTSYGTLVRDLAFHLGREYRLVVADEASLLRNPDADVSKALFKLKARGRIALTGTPVENRMQDLWSIFRFIAPGYLGNRADFKGRYEAPAAADGQTPRGLLDRLRLRTSPFVLRRTKDQVAKDLPDKVEIDEWLTLSEDQADLYTSLTRAGLQELEQIRDKQGEGACRMHLLTLLLRLRQVCVDPGLLDLKEEHKSNAVKIERLLELLSERAENGQKTLVFSQFSQNLRRIEKRVPEGSQKVFRIDGSTRNRQELVDSFQSYDGPAVFLISLKAGGYGLNLTAADTVIHLDPWWNPAVEAQATDRAHRIGQTRPVTVYRLLTRDTVEERVRRLQERKRAVIQAATGDTSTEAIPQNWTADDIEGLLR
ncbi:DEAD/DEAH box helicase [Luteolibacter luteus]|uniref:DEAD/DEAH box helicase n=1 Tax=Luteolibacter luteus TaxID=2728835 RepID=A0A858RQ64_9BACT|nr:DEAD/DEAH box helicase [Luteolibacter luteus]QJE98875.1 DEAD/DEAH box helicase [Luteolibacter luteus]